MKTWNKTIAGIVFAACAATLPQAALADQITGGPTGLTGPHDTITFDELGNLQGQTITNQFSAFGATFAGYVWDNATEGQSGSTGFGGGDLSSVGAGGTPDIKFNVAVTSAAFAIVDQGSTFTFTALLNGNVVDSFDLSVGFNPGAGFVGFSNELFDEIQISGGGANSIDTVQFTATPEPSSMILLSGVVGTLVFRRLRKRA